MAADTRLVKHNFFDRLTVLRAEQYLADFPAHRHDCYSITLVRSGRETTRIGRREILTPAGSISITEPDVLHANPNYNPRDYNFTTFYLSPEVLLFLNNQQEFSFSQGTVQDSNLFLGLHRWVEKAGSQQELRSLFLQLLSKHARPGKSDDLVHQAVPDMLEAVIQFIESNLDKKLKVEALAKVAKLSPFHFSRIFKQHKGISPLQYITLRRIETAGKLLDQGKTVTEAAHAVGFYDQSHFHRFFLRFMGVTPGHFLRSSKIVQVPHTH